MDNTFLSSSNIENIYEYINAEMVKNHNINLNEDSKNKKIVKKLTKTVFDKISSDISNGILKKQIGLNNFNDMVIKKCVPFLLNKRSESSVSLSKEKKKPKRRYSIKKAPGILNFNTTVGEHVNKSGNFQEYINDTDDFEKLVKESNRQINDSFKAYSEKQSVFNSHDSINSLNEDCDSNLASDFIVERCAIKDDIVNGKLDNDAFNDGFAKKIENGSQAPAIPSGNLAYESYDQMNVRDLLTNVLVNQKDHSSNEIDSYDGELYLPNLIREVGEEAPIQPLLFQNTKQGDERVLIKNLILDTGDYGSNGKVLYGSETVGKLDLTTQGSPSAVTNLGTNRWHKFRINLQDTFRLEKLMDVYVKSFTVVGATNTVNAQFFVLNIQELNINKPSNNRFIKDRLVFKNTNTDGATNSDVVTHTYPFRSYFAASINPTTLYNITLEVTNENNLSSDSDSVDDNTFKNADEGTNRIILELDFIPREKPNDIIFDRTAYGSALNAELSNT
jgi:hypothetical protein